MRKTYNPNLTGPLSKTKNAADVLRWLQASGYQTGHTQFYQDIKDGKLAKKDGFFLPSRVKKYAGLLKRAETGRTDDDYQTDLVRRKQEEELEKLRIQNRQLKRKEDEEMGKLLPREDFERELAARLVVLNSDAVRMVQTRADEFVHLVGGDPKKSDELSAALISAFGDMLNEYATTKKFHVMILPVKENPSISDH